MGFIRLILICRKAHTAMKLKYPKVHQPTPQTHTHTHELNP